MGYTLKQRDGWGFMNVVTWDHGPIDWMRQAIHVGHPGWARCSERIWVDTRVCGGRMKHCARMRVRSMANRG